MYSHRNVLGPCSPGALGGLEGFHTFPFHLPKGVGGRGGTCAGNSSGDLSM